MRFGFQAVRWKRTEAGETAGVRTLAEAQAFAIKGGCAFWGVEVYAHEEGKDPRWVTAVAGPVNLVRLGAKIRLAFAGQANCPKIEEVCDLLNTFAEQESVTRALLRMEEQSLLSA